MKRDGKLTDISLAFWDLFCEHGFTFFDTLVGSPLKKGLINRISPQNKGLRRLLSVRMLTRQSSDGAFKDGPAVIGSAKFAMRKGLPGLGQKRMAVENEPHTVDDFSGEIRSGYGEGKKTLIWAGPAAIKSGSRRWIGRVNIHEHQAVRAGLHYDFVAEGVTSGADQFEVNIPSGEFKGRYAFVRPEGFETGNVLVVRMKDMGIKIAKPNFILKHEDYLAKLDADPNANVIVEWKPDGSVGNVLIHDNRAIITSHREGVPSYYDKLPSLEWLQNKSRLLSNRLLFSGPDQQGTVLRAELFHPDGAARVGGILNSSADKAIAYQEKHGPVIAYVWDIAKLRGRDVTNKPYSERREIYEGVVQEMQRFNPNWKVVPQGKRPFVGYYRSITQNRKGLPFSEGVVVKAASSNATDSAYKVKARESMDVRVVSVLQGEGKRQGQVGRLLVETNDGGRGEVGSFKSNNRQLRWMWLHRNQVIGQVIEILAQDVTKSGSVRAGVFLRFHPDKSDIELPLNWEEE